MAHDAVIFYLRASSRQPGALGIFQAFADEDTLVRALDWAVGSRDGQKRSNQLQDNELHYGWLRDKNAVVDEVMLSRPREGVRVLMTHGGANVAEAVCAYLEQCGFAPLTDGDFVAAHYKDPQYLPYDPLLAACVTQAQVAAVLEARARAEASGGPPVMPTFLLATHRLVLAGPPNAGKSSLLNRLAGYERAFVHEQAGATRDAVDELVDLGGFAVLLGDLPGFTQTSRGLDREAWLLASQRLGLAEAVAFVCDSSREWDEGVDQAAREVASRIGPERPVLVVENKADLPRAWTGEPWRRHFPRAAAVRVCSLPGGEAKEVMDGAVYGLLGER